MKNLVESRCESSRNVKQSFDDDDNPIGNRAETNLQSALCTQRAWHAVQLRIDLITNVSHDLKTPLTSMVGYIELIKKEELSDLVRDYVDVLSERAEKLKEMINSLFSLAKASSGNIELHPEKFELNRLVEQIFADMDDHVKESELQFVKQLTEENTEIISDNKIGRASCRERV